MLEGKGLLPYWQHVLWHDESHNVDRVQYHPQGDCAIVGNLS